MDYDDIQRLFDAAILREVASFKFYSAVAKKAANARVREIFSELAEQEKGHEELLTRFKHDPTFVMNFKAPPNYRVAEETETEALTADMRPADAIATAMHRELVAMNFYQDLAEMTSDPSFAEICVSLANMEAEHKQRLENLFVDIGYPEVW